MIRNISAALFAILATAAGVLMAASPSGVPARLRVQSVGVNQTAGNAGTISQTVDGLTRNAYTVIDTQASGRTWVFGPGVGGGFGCGGTSYGFYDATGSRPLLTLCPSGGVMLGAATGTDPGLGGLNIDGALQVDGVAVPQETSGSFTLTFTDACTTTPTQTVDWVKIGNMVTLTIVGQSGFGCTSDSTQTVSDINVPAALRPTAVSPMFPVPGNVVNNGASNAEACAFVSTTGYIAYYLKTAFGGACSVTGWTAAGSKNPTVFFTMTYFVNNP